MRGLTWPPLVADGSLSYPLGPFAWLPPPLDFGTEDPFADLLALVGRARYVLEAEPYDGTAVGSLPSLFLGPFLSRRFAAPPTFSFVGASTSVYLADSGGFISKSTDTPASTPFPPVLSRAYAISARIGGGSGDRLAGASLSVGDIQIANGTGGTPEAPADGDNDYIVNQSWGGQLVTIKAGSYVGDQSAADWAYSQFVTILRGNVSAMRANDGSINLSLTTRDAILDTRLTRAYYAGTGGYEGPASLLNTPRPLPLGRCRNIPLVQLDLATQIWQAGEELSAVIAVRDIGLSVTFSGSDYSNYANLAAATVPTGQYSTSLAQGLIRFGSDPILPTADVDGYPGAGSTAPAIIDYLLRNRLGQLNLSSSDIDSGSFNTADIARPWTCGVYISAETTARQAADALTRSLGGWLTPTRRGLFQIGLWQKPTTTLGNIDGSIIATTGITLQQRWKAVNRVDLGYRPVWRVMTDAELSETVTAATRAFLTAGHTFVDPVFRSVQDRDAAQVVMTTTLDDAADAADLAEIVADLLAWGTHVWRVPIRTLALRYWVGDARTLIYPRFGLGNGAPFIVIAIDDNDSMQNALELWGGIPE